MTQGRGVGVPTLQLGSLGKMGRCSLCLGSYLLSAKRLLVLSSLSNVGGDCYYCALSWVQILRLEGSGSWSEEKRGDSRPSAQVCGLTACL